MSGFQSEVNNLKLKGGNDITEMHKIGSGGWIQTNRDFVTRVRSCVEDARPQPALIPLLPLVQREF